MNKTVKTYWQPKGQNYWAETTTTLEDGMKYGAKWAKDMQETGASFWQMNFETVANPGILIVVANVI